MPSRTITEIIQMYSTGIISRECLEHEIRSWNGEDKPETKPREAEGCIVLYPDASGTWRAAT